MAACSEPNRSTFDAGSDDADDASLDGATRCTSDPMCDDRIACTIDHCRAGTCTHEPCTDCCPDGLQCMAGYGCGRAPTPCTTDSECGDGIRCTLDRCRDGRFCEHSAQESLCDSGQICLAAVGCIRRPPDRCAVDADCNIAPCSGQWRCAPELGCQFRAPTNCDDGDDCTTDTCLDDRGGCQHARRDDDNDGHVASTCGGDDCDDGNRARHPGATDTCGNGIDEDCDGSDRGCCMSAQPCATACGSMGTQTCTAAGAPDRCVPPAESCNGRDDDCDGAIDNTFACARGSTTACTTSCGSTGMTTCTDGCAAGPCMPPAEACNGRDDNCNGTVDEGCCASSMPCTTACGTMGLTSCTAMGTPGACAPPAETCNGRDDNCDGMIDNGFACARGSTASCTTTCGSMGVSTCSDACVRGACVPPAEACNGRDDNCNGTVDEGCCAASMPCTTTCGSTGVTSCTAMGTAGPCVAPAETCNGRDDNCNGMIDDGFACVRGSTGACATACGSMGTRTCNPDCTWGPCAAPAETCNGRDDNCDGVVDNGFACAAGATGACTTSCGSTGRRTCLGSCSWDTCVPPAETCNGADDNCNATCDEGFTCCARSTRDCSALGFVSGTATCRADCGGWDTAGCSNCGNRMRDGTEQCDGADLGGATCASRGFGAGTLRCASNCTFDTTGCGNCGNARIDTGETCDGTNLNGQTCASLAMGFSGGTLRCNASCAFDTSMCTRAFDPTGTWVTSPGVNTYCAFGAVSISFGNLTFTDTGSALSVRGGGINCTMTGASARTSRMVNVTCSLPGACTETYTLTGSFSTDNAFSGSFTARFTGSGCFDCATRTFTVTSTR
ncbi:MAG: putative metal-binding motif-containing protein [Polyangiales bacterium]